MNEGWFDIAKAITGRTIKSVVTDNDSIFGEAAWLDIEFEGGGKLEVAAERGDKGSCMIATFTEAR